MLDDLQDVLVRPLAQLARRAEGYGFLSVSRFIIRIQEFCSSDAPWSIKMLTDNPGLLTHTETILQYLTPFPNFTLLPDWDLTHETAESLRLLPKPPQLVHVKGHQDDHQDYSELSLEAQLNVDADTEAGFHQCTYPGQRPVVPRLPSNGKVICSKLNKHFREAFTVPIYFQQLKRHFCWTPSISQTINWQAYTQAIGRFLNPTYPNY
jgi:hypothetical protein